MTNILTFHMVRHGPVHNPDKIWYGRDVEFDLKSLAVVRRFNHLAMMLPTDPHSALWYSSDYPRAHEMCKSILKATGKTDLPDIVVNPNFGEQRYGLMEGMRGHDAKDHPELKPYFQDMWTNAPPGGESMQMLQRRVGEELDKVAGQAPAHIQHIVITGHGGENMAAFAHATGQNMIDVFLAKKLDVRPSFSYMSLLVLEYNRDEQKWTGGYEYETGLPRPVPI